MTYSIVVRVIVIQFMEYSA